MSWVPPYPTNEMLALQAKGWSASRIAIRYKVTRNAVIGRLTRVRARLAVKDSAGDETPSALRALPQRAGGGQDCLIANKSEDRGAYLDALIWKRSSYLNALREEGGL